MNNKKPSKIIGLFIFLHQVVVFLLLLLLYLTAQTVNWLYQQRYFPKFLHLGLTKPIRYVYQKTILLLDHNRVDSISRVNLIDLSISNMMAKKTRTSVTIGGMMIGIGAIVFLVSIGYGLQKLVVNRVVRLEEMKQTDISPQVGGKLKINDKTVRDFSDLEFVELALPVIAVVGRVNYQNSVTDMAVYGVTTQYLEQSAIQPIEGTVFDSNELTTQQPEDLGRVATEYVQSKQGERGEKIQDIEYSIDQSSWIKVRESASTSAKILGYTKRVEGVSVGEEIWGDTYLSDDDAGSAGETSTGAKLGKWIKAPVLLWKEQLCDVQTEGDCEDGEHVVLRDDENKQIQTTGYFAQINITIAGAGSTPAGSVRGETTEQTVATTEFVDTQGEQLDFVEIASESGIVTAPDTKTVALSINAKKQAVVNRAMLKVLGIPENEAVGKVFTASFVVVSDLLAESKEKVESIPAEYTIVGVTPEEKSPVFYVPFIDLRSLGITNYSQIRVVVADQADLSQTRKQIEAMGYVTRSVVDTVAQINALFASARTILLLLGMVALAVAALGMFNTLTVSLLERTKEVGLFKALGMTSSEVQELFLTESMIMGFFGGILGIFLGLLAGKLVGIIFSIFTIAKGVGFVDISFVPLPFLLVVVCLSLLVGIATGIYPAKRATKISALNALRYE